MDDIEISIDRELFRISERREPDGSASYDFTWLNGPNDGTYGFTIGLSSIGRGFAGSRVSSTDTGSQMTPDMLENEARGFLRRFYEPNGIRDEDFPNHMAATSSQDGAR